MSRLTLLESLSLNEASSVTEAAQGLASLSERHGEDAAGAGAGQREGRRPQQLGARQDGAGEGQYVGSSAYSVYYMPESGEEEPQHPRRPIGKGQSMMQDADGNDDDDDDALFRTLAVPGQGPTRDEEQVLEAVRARLPPRAVAVRCLQVYVGHVSWMYSPIDIDELVTEAWDPFYGGTPGASLTRAALLLVVLALGRHFDSDVAESDGLGRDFVRLAWHASHMTMPRRYSLTAMHTTLLLGLFVMNTDGGMHTEDFYPLMGAAVRRAIGYGLHRASAERRCDEAEKQRRRVLFWELYSSDAYRGLAYCRPTNIQGGTVDVALPASLPVYFVAKHRLAMIINRALAEVLCQPSPRYDEALRFDAELRQLLASLPRLTKFAPYSLADIVARDAATHPRDLHTYLQAHTLHINVHQALLHLHRPWLARAIQAPGDPLASTHVHSVVAVGESSRALIGLGGDVCETLPVLARRWGYFWVHVFDVAICQAVHAALKPATMAGSSAYLDVQRALDVVASVRPHLSAHWAARFKVIEDLRNVARDRIEGTSPSLGASPGAPSSVAVGHGPLSDDGALRLLGAEPQDAAATTTARTLVAAQASTAAPAPATATTISPAAQTTASYVQPADLLSGFSTLQGDFLSEHDGLSDLLSQFLGHSDLDGLFAEP